MQSSEKMAVISIDSPWGAVAAPFAPVSLANKDQALPLYKALPCSGWQWGCGKLKHVVP